MADKEEKIVSEAEEAAKTEEVKEAAPEVKEEKKEKAVKAEKKPVDVKKIGIFGGAAVAVVVVVLLVLAFVNGSTAISAYKNEDFAKAYSASKMGWFMSSADKDVIKVGYLQEVLCAEGKFYDAYELLESTGLSKEEKDKVYASNGNLAMCKPGQVATFGEYGTIPVEWIVLEVNKVGGRAQALLMTKDIIGTSGSGWGTTTVYGESDLNDFCNVTFKGQFEMKLTDAQKKSVCQSKIPTPEGDVVVYAFAPTKAMIEKYFVGDLAQYKSAVPTQAALMAGVTGNAVTKAGSYYLRDIGKLEGSTQYACGVNHEGVIGDGFSMSNRNIGVRLCINVDLGEI